MFLLNWSVYFSAKVFESYLNVIDFLPRANAWGRYFRSFTWKETFPDLDWVTETRHLYFGGFCNFNRELKP